LSETEDKNQSKESVIEVDQDVEFVPPSEDRVRRRAWAISSVVCRAFLESFEDPVEAATLHSRLLTWIDLMDLRPEFESSELATIEADLGSLDPQTAVNGTWRSEGLVVLAWALRTTGIPAHDQLVDPSAVANSVFFLAENARDSSKSLKLRPPEELAKFSEIQLALHWRIRDFSLRPQAMDFRKYNEKPWYGSPIEGIPLAEDDLAIDGLPIAKAPTARFRECQSIAMERHRAINWLEGWHETYSEVDTST
jgi:hypothetical protein